MFWKILHLFSQWSFFSHKDTRKTMIAKDNGKQEQDDENEESSKALHEKAMEVEKKLKTLEYPNVPKHLNLEAILGWIAPTNPLVGLNLIFTSKQVLE